MDIESEISDSFAFEIFHVQNLIIPICPMGLEYLPTIWLKFMGKM